MDALVDAIHHLSATAAVSDILDSLARTASDYVHPHRPRATGAVYSHHLRTVVVIGDVWVSVDDRPRFYGHETERVLAEVRRVFTELELARGTPTDLLRQTDPGRAAILPLLAREAEFANVDDAAGPFFASIDGSPIPRALIRVIDVPGSARSLAIASDGYPELGTDLARCERLLEDAVTSDPLMIRRHVGTKAAPPGAGAYDDRSFVSLDISD